jgi:predicted CXXCH cytochrome family protein
MKKLFIFCTVLFLTSALFGQGIVGSAHDFTASGWNTTGEICIVCHTPHNADTTVADSPLWNHEVTVATYTLYASGTFDATDQTQPDGVSKLCLSCHDGTVALDNFGGATGGTNFATGAANVGTDLANDHPVSFSYQSSIDNGDSELFATTASTSMGGTIASDLLSGGNVECSSCHDVHNAYGFDGLLKIDNAGSALCLTCHDK